MITAIVGFPYIIFLCYRQYSEPEIGTEAMEVIPAENKIIQDLTKFKSQITEDQIEET